MEKTVGHRILDIESEVFDVPKQCYERLDEIIEAAKSDINPKADPGEILVGINLLLLNQGMKISQKKDEDDYVLLSKCIQKKEFGCNKSLLYLTIAEALDLPLKGVLGPEHLFVRWIDGKDSFNWETTSVSIHTDLNYINWLKIHKKSLDQGVYMKNLTRNEIISIGITHTGLVLEEEGRFSEALDYLTKGIELDPKDPVAHNMRGLIKYEQGNKEQAIDDLVKSIELDPNFSEPCINLGIIYYELDKPKKAIKYYDKAIRAELKQSNPKPAIALFNKGLVLDELHDKQGAVHCFRKAVEADKDIMKDLPYGYKAAVKECKKYFEVGAKQSQSDEALAIKSFNKAIELDPEFIRAHYFKAWTWHHMGQFKLAKEIFSKVLTLDKRLKNLIPEVYGGTSLDY